MNAELETTLWFGKVDHKWPVHAFINESHAMYWLASMNKEGTKAHLWKADLVNIIEAKLVTVEPYLEYMKSLESRYGSEDSRSRSGAGKADSSPEAPSS